MPAHDLRTRATWQRWEMESLDALKARTRPLGPDATAHAQADRAHRHTLAQAREEGSAKGYRAGHEQGLREGHAEGFARGLAEGREQGLAEGREAGHQEGLTAGLAEGAQAARAEATRIHDLADTVAAALDTLEADVGQSVISLAVSIAEHVLHSALATHPQHLTELIKEIVSMSQAGEASLKLRVHPQDAAMLEQALAGDSDTPRYRLIPDERITRGGCTAQTALGSIDATLETRWKRAIAALGQEEAPAS